MADLTLCQSCDQLVRMPSHVEGLLTKCPRCKSTLPHSEHAGLAAPIALSLAGIMLLVPANTLPIMTLGMLGQSNSNTMINGAHQLYVGGYWWMAFLVFACSVVVPAAVLILRFCICIGIAKNLPHQVVAPLLKVYEHLTHWAMLDVYMLGILVAFVKMVSMGDLVVGLGLYSFVALMLVFAWSTGQFNVKALWHELQPMEP